MRARAILLSLLGLLSLLSLAIGGPALGAPPSGAGGPGELAPAGGSGLPVTVRAGAAPVVDLLVLYTPATRRAAGGEGSIRARIAEAVDFTNAAFEGSGIEARARLADAAEIEYQASRVDILHDLFFLVSSPRVAARREAVRADVVALIKPTRAPTKTGISVGMNREQFGTQIAPAAVFVTSLEAMPGNFTHELGHTFGCDHHPEEADAAEPSEAAFPDAFAHGVPGVFHTLMLADASVCPGCVEIPRFSNPEILFQGRPTGVAGSRNNARAIRETAPVVATFGELPGRIGFAVDRVEVDEAAGEVEVEVFRTDGSIGPVSVEYAAVAGSGRPGEDFQPVAGTLSWATGEADVLAQREVFDLFRRRITIPIVDDGVFEGTESFSLVLSAPTGGASLGRSSLEVAIRDDEPEPEGDFDYRVTFVHRDGTEVPGRREPACIPEATCFSGALPGRSEVFLRVVGPKPNGFLWPTLVKFSTSQVRIEVERRSTGERREYVLAGASPGVDVLPGRFDRFGFPAEPAAASGSARRTGRAPGSLATAAPVALAGRVKAHPPPPSDVWMSAPELPGFRFQVRITSGSGARQETRVEPDCIAETACVSGALAGRSELFLRVVGPKPNGFLWPTLVRFSTSGIEVWIEQTATGQVRYYRLAAASPGDDSLDGLFDRTGFSP